MIVSKSMQTDFRQTDAEGQGKQKAVQALLLDGLWTLEEGSAPLLRGGLSPHIFRQRLGA